jgi:hypothetical protein
MTQLMSPEGRRRVAEAPRAKEPYVDIFNEFIAVEEVCGPCARQTVIFHRDEKLSPYKIAVAKRHGVPIRWR